MAVKIIRQAGRPSNIALALEGWAVEIANWVISWQYQNDRIASKESINSHVVTMTTQRIVNYAASDYLQYALKGREAGKAPPPDNIKEWIKQKPIDYDPAEISLDSLAYLIGQKIAKEGTNPPHLTDQNYSMVVNMVGIKYIERISDGIAEEFSEAMINAFVTGNNVFTEKK